MSDHPIACLCSDRRNKEIAAYLFPVYESNILAAAADKGASDIHIEPRVGTTIVRLRVDGMLREIMTIPSEHQASVVSRVKILSNMDIADAECRKTDVS